MSNQRSTHNNKSIDSFQTSSRSEIEDNLYAANISLLIYFPIFICYLLTELGIFYIPIITVRIASIFCLFLVIFVEFIGRTPEFSGDNNTKYLIVLAAIINTLVLTSLFNFHAVLALFIPIAVAINYHSTKVSIFAFIGLIVCSFVSPILGLMLGTWQNTFFTMLSWCATGIPGPDSIPSIIEMGPFPCIILFISLPQVIIVSALGSVVFLTNKRKQNTYKEQIIALRESRDAALDGLADIVENRDSNTGGHIKRTSEVVKMLISALCEDSEDSFYEDVIKAAPLHDLGKIAIPDSILTKPGRLTPEEFEYIKIHPKKGYSIVKTILRNTQDECLLKVAENIALYHHEKYDGTGYPDGLKGDAIPLEARIMAIADVYDALVSKRCYKESIPHEEAFKVIKDSMGTHFDPNLWFCFAKSHPDIVKYYENHKELIQVPRNFIWDLDGTLIDSYKVIVDSLYEVSVMHGVNYSKEKINKIIIDNTADTYLDILHEESGIDLNILIKENLEISKKKRDDIGSIRNASEILSALEKMGAKNFVYTHRGESAHYILDRLGLTDYFVEIVTGENGFPRKPNGDGVKYLVDKYLLNPQTTYYVGDRTIDMDCAKDAGVKGILYKPAGSYCDENGSEDYIVNDLMEIIDIEIG